MSGTELPPELRPDWPDQRVDCASGKLAEVREARSVLDAVRTFKDKFAEAAHILKAANAATSGLPQAHLDLLKARWRGDQPVVEVVWGCPACKGQHLTEHPVQAAPGHRQLVTTLVRCAGVRLDGEGEVLRPAGVKTMPVTLMGIEVRGGELHVDTHCAMCNYSARHTKPLSSLLLVPGHDCSPMNVAGGRLAALPPLACPKCGSRGKGFRLWLDQDWLR